MLPAFALSRPTTVQGALELIDEDRVPYWGGTELLLAMRVGLLRPDVLVDLKRIPELRRIAVDGEELVIGAGCSHAELAASPIVRDAARLLAEVESGVGNVRVRSQGSVGGNLCFAEPRSDVAAVLIAMDASVELRTAGGSRNVAVRDFVLGPYWTDREPHELLTTIRVPLPAADGVYRRFRTSERPTVAVAAVRRASGVRVVIGAVSDRPYVVDAGSPAEIDVDEIGLAIDPTPDLAGSVRYKRHVTTVCLRRALRELEGDA